MRYSLRGICFVVAGVSFAEPAGQLSNGVLTLENSHVRVRVNILKGASLGSFYLKREKKELVKRSTLADIFLLPVRRVQRLEDLKFESLGRRSSAHKLVWELSASCPPEKPMGLTRKFRELRGGAWDAVVWAPEAIFSTEPLQNLLFVKRYTLSTDSPVLEVEYELQNKGDGPVSFCLGTVQRLPVDDGAVKLCLPSREGPISFDLPLSPERRNIIFLAGKSFGWLYDLPAGWSAWVGREGGKGLLVWSESSSLSFLGLDLRERELTLGRTRIKLLPGESFRTRLVLMPLGELSRVDGCAEKVAFSCEISPVSADGRASLYRRSFTDEVKPPDTTLIGEAEGEIEEEEIEKELMGNPFAYRGQAISAKLNLFAWLGGSYELILSLRRNPRGRWREFEKRRVRLSPGGLVSVETSLKPRLRGTYILRAELMGNGGKLATFEYPVIAGSPSGFYLPEQPEKIGKINDEYWYWNASPKPQFPIRWDWEPSMEVETPHIKFARPLSGGPVKALIVVPYYRSREVVELAQRMDIDYDCVITGVAGYRKKWEGIKGILKQYYAPPYEVDRLKSYLNRRHDVIIMPMLYGDWFPLDVVEEIARQVEEDGVGLILVMPEQIVGPLEKFSKIASKDEALGIHKPFKTATVGRGRVAILDGGSAIHTPWVGESEGDYSDFLRLVLWVSQREAPLSLKISPGKLKRDSIPSSPLQVILRNAGEEDFKGELRITIRRDLIRDFPFYGIVRMEFRLYPVWEDYAEFEKSLWLAGGEKKTLSIPLPLLPSGSYSVDATLLKSDGVISWRRSPLTIFSETRITEISIKTERIERKSAFLSRMGTDLVFPVRPDESVRFECKLKGKGATVARLSARDPWGRILLKARAIPQWNGGEGSVRFTASFHRALHRIAVISVRLYDKRGCVDERRLIACVEPRPERVPAFEFGSYSICSLIRPEVTGYDTRYGAPAFSVGLAHAWCNRGMQEYGGWLPSAEKILPPGWKELKPPDVQEMKLEAVNQEEETEEQVKEMFMTEEEKKKKQLELQKKGWIRVPCLLDPKWRAGTMKAIKARFKQMSIFGPFKNFLVDEWFYYKERTGPQSWRRNFVPGRDTNICRSKYCLKAFSSFVKELYGGDLQRLNCEWSTDYKRWEEVDPPLLTTDPNTPPTETQIPHIIDHRRFIDNEVAELFKEFRDTVKEVNPLCEVGISGLWKTSIWNGIDISLISKYAENNNLYRDFTKWFSFNGRLSASWVGYRHKYSPIRESWTAWANLFAGRSGIVYYGKRTWPMHYWDRTFIEGPKALYKTMRFIRERGIDRLLVGHRFVDPVAIHFDTRSIYVALLQDWQENPERFVKGMRNAGRSYYEFCHKVSGTYKSFLSEKGFQYFWTSHGQLDRGSFGRFGKPKLLLLPYTQCLSDNQATTLEKFVREGGVLVGDVHTGFRDDHGKLRAKGALDGVFGIKRTGEYKMRLRRSPDGKPVVVEFSEPFGEPFSMTFGAVGPGDVTPTTSKPLAHFYLDRKRQPAFLINRYHKGVAIYLNFIPSEFRKVRLRKDEDGNTIVEEIGGGREAFKRIFDKLLDLAGLKSPISTTPGIRIFRFGEGNLLYIGAQAGYKNTDQWEREYEIRLPEPRHIYDVRASAYVGYTDTIKVRFNPLKLIVNQLYALLPYRVAGIVVSLEQRELTAGETLRFSARLLPAEAQRERHILCVRAINPRGEDVRWYRVCIETRGGVATGRVDLAFNEPPGRWKLRLIDSATGTTAEVPFVVTPPRN